MATATKKRSPKRKLKPIDRNDQKKYCLHHFNEMIEDFKERTKALKRLRRYVKQLDPYGHEFKRLANDPRPRDANDGEVWLPATEEDDMYECLELDAANPYLLDMFCLAKLVTLINKEEKERIRQGFDAWLDLVFKHTDWNARVAAYELQRRHHQQGT